MKAFVKFSRGKQSVCGVLAVLVAIAVIEASAGGSFSPGSLTGGTVSWFDPPQAESNGWYWTYDDAEPGPPFDDPVIAPMPQAPYSNFSIYDNPLSNKVSPYNDFCFAYVMPDSFWYFDYWIEPGDTLYVSPDGWVSFDFIPQAGYPNPPTAPAFPNSADPNMVIAPLWADYNPTRTPGNVDNNRVYVLFDDLSRVLTAEWYLIEAHSTGNTYTFLLQMQLGGQDNLVQYPGCGVVFSYHFIHFVYNQAGAGWDADNAVTGFEDPDGEQGITYEGTINTTGDDFHAVRSGYKRIFKNDVAADLILSPGTMVMRYTPIEPKVVVANVGTETEHFTVSVMAHNMSTGEVDYANNLGAYNLAPGAKDTLVAPCWTPGEVGTPYFFKLDVELDRDSCLGNNHNQIPTTVSCDDTLEPLYHWPSSGGEPCFPGYWDNNTQLAMFFPASDGGVLVLGGKVQTPVSLAQNGPFLAAAWSAEDGCGLPVDPPLVTAPPEGENWSNGIKWIYFHFGEENRGMYINAARPGNIWVGVVPTSSVDPAGFGTSFADRPLDHSCRLGGSPYRFTAVRDYGAWLWPDPGVPWPAAFPNLYLDLFVHLTFGEYPYSPKPAPPCYDEGVHDITAVRFEEPGIDWVEAGVPLNPQVVFANVGLTAEQLVPVKFMVVEEVEPDSTDTVFTEQSLVSEIGFLGDPADDPDSVYVSFPAWTPEGICGDVDTVGDYQPASYELLGVVHLGKVGPDSTDHCPYNDTVRRTVVCLFSHDVGASHIEIVPYPYEEPNFYPPGTDLTITATVTNFGFNAEHNFEVRCEVMDLDSNELVWHSLMEIEVLDWRGNPLERPYETDVVFAGFTTPSQNRMTIECRTELEGDQCPDNDHEVRFLNTGISEESAKLQFSLQSVKPNPFTSSTTVFYSVPRAVNVSIKVFDVGGQLVTVLTDGAVQPGRHSVTWDGSDVKGRKVAQGIYLVRMESENFSATRKVVLY